MSQDILKQLLDYNPETGIFIWKVNITTSIFAGTEAGSIDTKGYIKICIRGRRYGAHALAWFYIHGELTMVDHENNVPHDNRLSNLRKATYSQNNHRKFIHNPHGFIGVRFRSGSYQAHIRIDGIVTRIGTYKTAEEAGQAYKEKAKEVFGEFANG